MGAKRSGEMKLAIILWKRGKRIPIAAAEAGVHPASLYKVVNGILGKRRTKALDKFA